jgi:hypothetical protein
MVNVNLALGYRNTREMVILSCGTDKILDLQ